MVKLLMLPAMFQIVVIAYKKRGYRRESIHKTQAPMLRDQSYQLNRLVKVMVANKHPVLSHTLVRFLIHIVGEGNEILFNTSHHRYSEEIGIELAHMRSRRVPLVKWVSMDNN